MTLCGRVFGRSRAAVVLALAALAVGGGVARAAVRFGANDVRTVFFIAKSDDRNRVDYGIHLNPQCEPEGAAPLYPYWHRFEPGQPTYGELGLLDKEAYGIRSQSVERRAPDGSEVRVVLRALPDDPVLVQVRPDGRGGCRASALARIGSSEARLDHVFVQLAGPGRPDHITIAGADLRTGEPVAERRNV